MSKTKGVVTKLNYGAGSFNKGYIEIAIDINQKDWSTELMSDLYNSLGNCRMIVIEVSRQNHGCMCKCHLYYPEGRPCGDCSSRHPTPMQMMVEKMIADAASKPKEKKMIKTEAVKDLFRALTDAERALKDIREATSRHERLQLVINRLLVPATFDMPSDAMSAETHEKFVQYEGKTFRVRAKGKDVTIVEVQVEGIR